MLQKIPCHANATEMGGMEKVVGLMERAVRLNKHATLTAAAAAAGGTTTSTDPPPKPKWNQ